MEPALPHPYQRHPQHSNSITSHDSSSVSSSSPQTLVHPPANFYPSGPPRAPGSSATPHHLHSLARSPVSVHAAPYSHPYGPNTGSPRMGSVSLVEQMGSSLSAQKRAYRQRRKDPSCDACRERKVKCDATETSSCSECSSRSVKCQFTKETNRRMSSIKQVQDLQSQLMDAQQEISRLQGVLQQRGPANVTTNPANPKIPKLPDLMQVKERRAAPPAVHNFDGVRQSIRHYGRGIFKPPPPYRHAHVGPIIASEEPPPPPKVMVDRLLYQYFRSVHRNATIVHWPSFINEVEKVYSAGTFQGMPQIWVSVFYAILANGTLQTTDGDADAPTSNTHGLPYLVIAARMINTWTDEFTVHHSRATLLISMFLTELNLKSAGWVWLGNAVRISLDLGLHLDVGPWPPLEAETRRRVWWSIYGWDRVLSIELGRPLLIVDEDCNVELPTASSEDWVVPLDTRISSRVDHCNLTTLMPVHRVISELKNTLKSLVIAPATLQTYDAYFAAVMRSFPDFSQINSDAYLDPQALNGIFTLETCRIHLYRHNLSPACSRQDRIDAMDRLFVVAQDTARCVLRTMQSPPSSPVEASGPRPGIYPPTATFHTHFSSPSEHTWSAKVRMAATNLFCTHIWRCTLVLCFCGDFLAASHLVRVSTTVGDIRKINVACGRNLAFFLDRLLERFHDGCTDRSLLEQDEEMLAYASGDMQGNVDSAWVWTGSDTGFNLNSRGLGRMQTSPSAGEGRNGDGPNQTPGLAAIPEVPLSALLTEREIKDWGGWERVERMLAELEELHRRGRDSGRERVGLTAPHWQQPVHNERKRVHLAPLEENGRGTGDGRTGQANSVNSTSRISIANII